MQDDTFANELTRILIAATDCGYAVTELHWAGAMIKLSRQSTGVTKKNDPLQALTSVGIEPTRVPFDSEVLKAYSITPKEYDAFVNGTEGEVL
jgi:hypothetical protein